MVKLTFSTAATPLYRLVNWRISSMLPSPLGMDDADQVLEALALGRQDAAPQPGEAIVAAARVIELRRRALAGFFDQLLIHETLERAVQRRRPQPYLAGSAVEDLLHDAVTVLVLAGEREEDVKPVRFQREERFRVLPDRMWIDQYIYRMTLSVNGLRRRRLTRSPANGLGTARRVRWPVVHPL